jgi:hypothetical protein
LFISDITAWVFVPSIVNEMFTSEAFCEMVEMLIFSLPRWEKSLPAVPVLPAMETLLALAVSSARR